MPNNLFEKYLPPRAQEIVRVIGLCAFQKLVAWRGGVYIYVPGTVTANSELVTAIGITAAKKLCAYYSGETLDIPKCEAAIIAIRNEEIKKRRQNGELEKDVALDVGLTARHVRKINAGVVVDDGQDDLFS